MHIDNLQNRQHGFTLVELLVGLVIGLIATLVIMQTFSSFEGNKRSTTGISDAQTSGSIGLFMIQRELQFAGYGIPVVTGTLPEVAVNDRPYNRVYQQFTGTSQANIEAQIYAAQAAAKSAYEAKIAQNTAIVNAGENYSALRCDPAPSLSIDLDDDPGTPAVGVNVTTPVTITENGTQDSITIIYGDTQRGSLPSRITDTNAAIGRIAVSNNLSCREDNVALILKDINKGVTECQAVLLKSSASGFTNAQLDADTTTVLVDPTTIDFSKVAVGDRLACMGRIRQITFDINNNQLRKNGQGVLDEVVSLQAQYGVSNTGNSEIVSAWANATGAWVAPSVTDRNRIKAVRIAIIARNNLLKKNVVSQECTGAAAGPARVCVWGADSGLPAALGANWDRYRYRVYELVVPIKNMLSASPQL